MRRMIEKKAVDLAIKRFKGSFARVHQYTIKTAPTLTSPFLTLSYQEGIRNDCMRNTCLLRDLASLQKEQCNATS